MIDAGSCAASPPSLAKLRHEIEPVTGCARRLLCRARGGSGDEAGSAVTLSTSFRARRFRTVLEQRCSARVRITSSMLTSLIADVRFPGSASSTRDARRPPVPVPYDPLQRLRPPRSVRDRVSRANSRLPARLAPPSSRDSRRPGGGFPRETVDAFGTCVARARTNDTLHALMALRARPLPRDGSAGRPTARRRIVDLPIAGARPPAGCRPLVLVDASPPTNRPSPNGAPPPHTSSWPATVSSRAKRSRRRLSRAASPPCTKC